MLLFCVLYQIKVVRGRVRPLEGVSVGARMIHDLGRDIHVLLLGDTLPNSNHYS